MRQFCVRPNALSVCLISFFISAYAPSAGAQSYVFSTIDDPNAASQGFGVPPRTLAFGLNDLGVIVGRYSHPPRSFPFSAFEYSGGNFSTIDYPGACCGTEALGINNSGVVVGDYNDNVVIHGYTLANGNYSTLDFPGAVVTTPIGINNHGVIVGSYQGADFRFHGFVYNGNFNAFDCAAGGGGVAGINDQGDIVEGCSNGSFKITAATGQSTPISFPGAFSTSVSSVNNSGQIVGTYLDANTDLFHGFSFFNGNYQELDVPGSVQTFMGTINNLGQIVGQYEDSAGAYHGFLASTAQLVDPVPDLLSGAAVRQLNSPDDAQILATKGQVVQGVAADGVTEVVVRIPAVNVGDQFTVTVLNDSTGAQSTLPDEDGALGNPGDTAFSQTQVGVTAVATNATNPNPMAFAVYRAPIDFARPTSSGGYKSGVCNNASLTDDQAACRTVMITAQNQNTGQNTNIPVSILRPPVVLIHGLWGSRSDWNNFSPLYSFAGADPRFYVAPLNYSGPPLLPILSSSPDYSSLPGGQGLAVLLNARANSLGFQYNASGVLKQVTGNIQKFKGGGNPTNTAVAAIQADLVTHSMGGDIARTLPLHTSFIRIIGSDNDFFSDLSLGQGYIHKLITIDTPHLGSTLATQMLQGQNSCVANALALAGLPAFLSVQVAAQGGTLPFSGAVGDLTDSPSQALQNIAAPGRRTLPTAFLAGTANFSNLSGLVNNGVALSLHVTCGLTARDPLALNLTATDWPSVFGGQANDIIVGLPSQLNGLTTPDPNSVFDGKIHSAGVLKLGFSGPTVLDSGPMPTQVINLLNTPVTNPLFHPLNP